MNNGFSKSICIFARCYMCILVNWSINNQN